MKIWLDVSGLVEWKGNFTGIQRVNYNIAEKLNNSGINYGLFAYDGLFKEVAFNELKASLMETNNKDIDNNKFAAKPLNVKKIIYYTLISSKKIAKRLPIESQIRSIYNPLRSFYRHFKYRPTKTNKTLFEKNSIIFIVDGNWQFQGYAEKMIEEKKKVGFKLVHVVQDLIAYKNPALANPGADIIIGDYFKKMFKAADALAAISDSTKNDIESFLNNYKINNKPIIYTITLGADITLKDKKVSAPLKLNLPKNFVLSVSTIEIRKNYLLFYYIYNLANQMNIQLPHLVIVGRKGWMANEAYSLLTNDPNVNKNITICTNIKDEELTWLYKNCLYTIFPSFYEGWGLPVAESLSYGKCCISSNTSSIPEAGKEFGIYVSPYDPAAFLTQMIRLTDKKNRSKLEKAIKSYKTVSWEDTLNQMLLITKKL